MKWIKGYGQSLRESMGRDELDMELLDAAWGDDLDKATRLLGLGADPNKRDHLKETPLHRAAKHGYEEMIRLLVANGADLEARSWNGQTPLYTAVGANNLSTAKILIDLGAEIDVKSDHYRTPLHMAHQRGHHEMARLLIHRGAHPAKGFESLDELQRFFRGSMWHDLSWVPGGLPAIEKSFRSAEIRKGLF